MRGDQSEKKKTMKTPSQKKTNRLPQESKLSQLASPQQTTRKHDGEVITARQQESWVSFEASIYSNDMLRARIVHYLDRFGLGSSSVMVDEALDFLVHKELGPTALIFNQTGKVGFNRRQVKHAVLGFMSRKEQQRHMTDLVIVNDDTDLDDFPNGPCGTHRASHLADHDHLTPDEHAARADARRAFYTLSAAIPARDRELFRLLLGMHETGTRAHVDAYASRQSISPSTVYDRLKKLALAIRQNPLFAHIAATYQPDFQPA